jgi:hypothetical protein
VLLSIANKFSPRDAARAFQMFISIGVRLIIASSTRSGSIEEALALAANKTLLGKIVTAQELRAELNGIIPSDEQFRQSFETATVSKGPFARYYLRSIERVAKKEPTPWFTVNDDKETINLEHILPQNPQGNWPQFTEDEASLYYKRIGNMVLLHRKTNADLKNADFATKSASYKDCPYELTAQIAKAKNWTPDTIAERQRGMAKLAVVAWPV